MKVAGWVRIWVVASAAIWLAGFIWLSRVDFLIFEDDPKMGTVRMPTLLFDKASVNPFGSPESTESYPERVQREKENWQIAWDLWLKSSWRAGLLPLVLFAPPVLGAIMGGLWWIVRGFSPAGLKG